MAALLPLLLFADGLLGKRLIAPGDGYQQNIPWQVIAARSWRAGDVPAWNPWVFSGSPLLASHQAAVLYPPNLLFLVLPPELANNFTIVFHLIVGGLGAWFLSRHLTRDEVGAAVAAVGFGMSGFMFGHLGHQNIVASVAWMPWVLYAYERLRERFTGKHLLVGSSAVALSVLAGHAQMLFISLLVLFVYAGVLSLFDLRTTKGRPFLIAVILSAAGLALSAVQLIPTLEIIGSSERSHLSYEEAMTYSFPKSHGILLFFPYLFGNHFATGPYSQGYSGMWNLTELSGYPGLAAAVFAVSAVPRVRRDSRFVALVVAGALALLLAFGPATPLSRLLYELPILGQFRSWARYIVVFDLAVALLAGYGVALLRSDRSSRSALRWGVVGLMVFVASAFVVTRLAQVRRFIPNDDPNPVALAVPLGAAILAAGAGLMLTKGWRVAAFTVVILVAADSVFSFGGFYEWRRGSPEVKTLARDMDSSAPFTWGKVMDTSGGIDRYLYMGGDIGPPGREFVNVTALKGIRSANGNDPLAPRDYLASVGMTSFGGVYATEDIWRAESRILDLLRVSTVLLDPRSSSPAPSPGSLLSSGIPIDGGRLIRFDYQPRLPEAFLVGTVRAVTRERVLAALRGRDPFDPRTIALIEEECTECPAGPMGSAGSVRRAVWGANSVTLDVMATRQAFLVLSQAWFPGWQARVDGTKSRLLRTNGLVQGVPISPGSHEIRLEYRVPGLRLGFLISLVALSLLVGYFLASGRRRRKPA